jgi:hypothetical protein
METSQKPAIVKVDSGELLQVVDAKHLFLG